MVLFLSFVLLLWLTDEGTTFDGSGAQAIKDTNIISLVLFDIAVSNLYIVIVHNYGTQSKIDVKRILNRTESKSHWQLQ